MLRTKNLNLTIDEISREWIFEHYLDLDETLSGQTASILSPFNPDDTNPSCKIYYSDTSNKYLFKDFSSGKSGDPTELVKELFNLQTRHAAVTKIIRDYKGGVGIKTKRVIKKGQKYKVNKFKTQEFSKEDLDYWGQFNIDTTILNRFRVKRLKFFVMIKENKEIVFNKELMYGYFNRAGLLCRIYQPKNKDAKFIKVKDYIQGAFQLTYKEDNLIILSSLKDGMAFTSMGINGYEIVAPDSENIPMDEKVIEWFKYKYKNVYVLFDNDIAGIKSAKKYQEDYGIKMLHLSLGKDIADCVRDFSGEVTKQFLRIEIKKNKI